MIDLGPKDNWIYHSRAVSFATLLEMHRHVHMQSEHDTSIEYFRELVRFGEVVATLLAADDQINPDDTEKFSCALDDTRTRLMWLQNRHSTSKQ